MKKNLFIIAALLLCAAVVKADCPPSTATATVTLTRRTGSFTVNSSGGTVSFSPGNLQYQASTNTWRFAPTQYTYVGNSVGNTNPTSTQSGWIDLFGWATSGWNNGNRNAYQPWSVSQTNSDYGVTATKTSTETLTGSYANGDWGVYNAAQLGSGWRTLTYAEWAYLVDTRSTTSGIRYAKATVTGIQGLIILPDDWSTSYYSLSSTNTANAAYNTNTISADDWRTSLEAYGAVFLPCAGYRDATTVGNAGSSGYYWSSTAIYDGGTYDLRIASDNVQAAHWDGRSKGYSVRLVQDL